MIERPLRFFFLVPRNVEDSQWDRPWWFCSCSDVVVGMGAGSGWISSASGSRHRLLLCMNGYGVV
jgi:hypothetical protein